MSKLWGGRFSEPTDKEVEAFTSSLAIDSRLWEADLQGSIAHARMLGRTGILQESEAGAIVEGLQAVRRDFEKGPPGLADTSSLSQAEDIHSEIERLLTDKIGSLAGKLHSARSRNDQVVTATRLYLRWEMEALDTEIRALQEWLIATSERHLSTILPGMTHFQHAQPVSLAHHLMAYFWMLERDRDRFLGCRARVNQLPLGSAALAGTSFPIDREAVAEELGFQGLCENSLDAVSDRDFVVEFLSGASLVMIHLSRLADELILWSSPEFGFIELSDRVTTGSSIMPQKKNPDVAELIRGRVGRVAGALTGSILMLKGLPLSYNRDFQEDKIHLFEGLDTTRACVRLMLVILRSASFRTDRMSQAVQGDFSNATDFADALVKTGMPFRRAHEVVGKIVQDCIQRGRSLECLEASEIQAFCPELDASIVEALKPAAVLAARTSRGGAGPKAVAAQIEKARQVVCQMKENFPRSL